jgi:nucleotide-binding universal stress UspA family protein
MDLLQRISFEQILCPTDLTKGSSEALRYAVALARAFKAKLLVIHCADSSALADKSHRGRIERQLKDSIQDHILMPDSSTLAWEALVVEGDPASAITREAARQVVDLIIIRSRRRPVAAGLLGSTAEAICRTAPCPVLVTHPHEQEWAGATTNEVDLRRLLVAYDYSDESRSALSYGLSLAQEYQAELHLIHVLPPRARSNPAGMASLPVSSEGSFEEAALRLQNVLPRDAFLWCEVKQAVREGHPYKEVLDYAKENGIDLICMGASLAGSRIQEVFGSTVDRVLRHAPCPVLVARRLSAAVLAAP